MTRQIKIKNCRDNKKLKNIKITRAEENTVVEKLPKPKKLETNRQNNFTKAVTKN